AYRYTTMAYDCTGGLADQIPYYTNPNVTFSGSATGSATQNNAQTIQDTRTMVANYRLGDYLRYVGPFNQLPMGNGSLWVPYSQVRMGAGFITATGTVSILAGTYPEAPITISRACTLSARNGTVTISAP